SERGVLVHAGPLDNRSIRAAAGEGSLPAALEVPAQGARAPGEEREYPSGDARCLLHFRPSIHVWARVRGKRQVRQRRRTGMTLAPASRQPSAGRRGGFAAVRGRGTGGGCGGPGGGGGRGQGGQAQADRQAQQGSGGGSVSCEK